MKPTIIIHNGIPTMTTDRLAAAYQVAGTTIKVNTVMSKHLFDEGKEYFKVDGVVLWTKEGAKAHGDLLYIGDRFKAIEPHFEQKGERRMNELQNIFEYQGKQIRTVMMNGETYFVAKDVCEFFGDTNYRRSISRLDEDEKGVSQVSTPGGAQEMTVVNEPGLYGLLFQMQPQKGNLPDELIEQRAEAIKQFKRWVTHEVLPSIRKTGGYMAAPQNYGEALRELATTWEAKQLAEAKVKELQPKADFFDAVASSKTAIQIGNVAKVLDIKGVGRNKLFEILRDKKVLNKENVPYQEFIDRGYFRVIEQKYNKPDGTVCVDLRTLVYQRGVDYIRKLVS